MCHTAGASCHHYPGIKSTPAWRFVNSGGCTLIMSCSSGSMEIDWLWEELTYWKRLWCWEGLGAGREGEGDDRGWDGWMASPTQWTWVWVNSRSWWWTGRPGVLQFMGWQRIGHDCATELNWSRLQLNYCEESRHSRQTWGTLRRLHRERKNMGLDISCLWTPGLVFGDLGLSTYPLYTSSKSSVK